MLDLGFSDDLAEINQLTSQRQQTMMFSATFAPRIQQLALRVMHDNGASVQKVQIDTPQEKHANIRQVLLWADNITHKRKLLDHWLRDASIDHAIEMVLVMVRQSVRVLTLPGVAVDRAVEAITLVWRRAGSAWGHEAVEGVALVCKRCFPQAVAANGGCGWWPSGW